MLTSSAINPSNLQLMEEMQRLYDTDKQSVSPEWQRFFKDIETTPAEDIPLNQDIDHCADRRQISVLQLINAYRFRGHKKANINPINYRERPEIPDLALDYHGLKETDMDMLFATGSLVAPEHYTLHEILDLLEDTYCRYIGVEYMHIPETAQKRWLQSKLEGSQGDCEFSALERLHILQRLISANGIEQYLHKRYVGQKRFSLEGGESLIPLMDELIQKAGGQHVKEIIIGMAHRGRLNMLVNILGKKPSDLFSEFEGAVNDYPGSGDVKYHQGFSSDVQTPGGPVHLALAFNPSHLEIINPVVEGSVRARQERRGDTYRNQVLPVLIHGDAAMSGQGVVMETLNLSQTRGYTTGGTIHVVINNQIGFTTSDPLDSRSTQYCTDAAKLIQAPVFHVNGDNPEAVILVTRLAVEYRMAYNRDVVIDLVCYRRHGHSEADEPAATQPMMYKVIRQHTPVHELYAKRLIDAELTTDAVVTELNNDYIKKLDNDEIVSRPVLTDYKKLFAADWTPFNNASWDTYTPTGLAIDTLKDLLLKSIDRPDHIELHPSVERVYNARRKMAKDNLKLDWGAAELLAYASLLEAGYPVRISGQDSGRGTFFHRHAVLHSQTDGKCYIPLQHISDSQPLFLIIDSLLSEEAVLGFEMGYSAAEPDTLVIWEAQFGDFANNAQVVIDQFISSSEAKWKRYSGLVMFLPHGYDGQGPEHSSARLERYLQLCAECNIQVCYPSTPAQMFHLLRRQMLRPFRRPLIVMSPKSLLRHKQSTSSLKELSVGSFQNTIDDNQIKDPDKVKYLILCSGKIYFDLISTCEASGEIAIARIEQLYPFPDKEIRKLFERYNNAKVVRWVQEEPWNQGAWFYVHPNFKPLLFKHQRLDCATRPPSASPAEGYLYRHIERQKAVVKQALDFSVVPAQNTRRPELAGRF